ncbi:hypothetical protein ABZ383_28225 [Streptomyces sp. NPDC005900]|uniref:DUF4097 family beta strand repeat-containing protein n=1 Tax=Streptomyces sp. NPDC005900 TaxID=3154569 RepID=UPI0033E10E3C
MPEWSIAEPREVTFDTPVTTLQVRIVNGTVNVVGTAEGSARLEVSEIEGRPLTITHTDDTLSVAYDDLPWQGLLKWLNGTDRHRKAVVSLTVPPGTRVEVGVIGAGATVSGIAGRTEVKGVSGDTTLVGLSGPVHAHTVSGSVEAQGLTGDLRFRSVAGDLTLVEAAGPSVRGDSVSGSMIVDLTPADRPTDVALTSVSGEIAIRLPHPADAEVEVGTASGSVSNAFADLRVSTDRTIPAPPPDAFRTPEGPGDARTWGWGAKRITGRLGPGNGRLKATTVSGAIALLRRPPMDEDLPEDAVSPAPAADATATDDVPTDKKVL